MDPASDSDDEIQWIGVFPGTVKPSTVKKFVKKTPGQPVVIPVVKLEPVDEAPVQPPPSAKAPSAPPTPAPVTISDSEEKDTESSALHNSSALSATFGDLNSNDKSMSVAERYESEDEDTVEPYALFARRGKVELLKDGEEHPVLGFSHKCDALRVFRAQASEEDILAALLDEKTLDRYGTKKVPLAFQGNGSSAVILNPETQSDKAYNLVSKDGNGGLKQFKTNWVLDDDGETRWYVRREYHHLNEKKVRRRIVYEVAADQQRDLVGHFVFVAYEWIDGQTPTQLPLHKEYQPRSIGKAVKREIGANLVGKTISPTVEYHKFLPSVCSPEDLLANPYYNKTGGKRYVSYAKSQVVTKKYDGKDYASLNGHPDLIPRRFTVEGVEKVNYIISSPYTLSLLKNNEHNPIQIDATFSMSNAFVVTTAFAVDTIVNRRTHEKTYIAGPCMLTQDQSKASYAEFASSLLVRFEETALGKDHRAIWNAARELVRADSRKALVSPWGVPDQDPNMSRWIVLSENGDTCSRVDIAADTGKAVCPCKEPKPCPHIVASAYKAGLLLKVLEWQKNIMRGSYLAVSGKKPGYSANQTRGNGNTKRNGREMDDPEELFTPAKRPNFGDDDHAPARQAAKTGSKCKPWQKDPDEPFQITKVSSAVDRRTTRVGCRLALEAEPPYLGMVVVREEREFQSGTTKTTNKKPRFYHMRTSCIRKRHPRFSVKTHSPVMFDMGWFRGATVEERELADLFKNGELF